MPSDFLHSLVKQMSASKETYSSICVSVLFGDTRSVHSLCQRKQNHVMVETEASGLLKMMELFIIFYHSLLHGNVKVGKLPSIS